MRSTPSLALPAVVVLALFAPAAAHAQRPTPHQAIERALAPITDQLGQLNATEAERRAVGDVMTRAETLAASLVEARHRGSTDRVQSIGRQLELLARLLRGRVEAGRAEADAVEAERAALAAEERRTQARAALERAVERRMELDRQPGEGAPGSSAPPGTSPAPGSSVAPGAASAPVAPRAVPLRAATGGAR